MNYSHYLLSLWKMSITDVPMPQKTQTETGIKAYIPMYSKKDYFVIVVFP